MSYVDALRYLGGLGRFGMRLGLESTVGLLSRLGDPHRGYPVIHVGGTNGKGSTAHAVAAILRAAGLQVGLFTSPHLLRFTERIQVSGQEIPPAELVRLLERVRDAAEGIPVTFFEVATALGFLHFARASVDVAVVEVGLGGRLDATNVVTPLCAIVTSVGLDHREHLGSTLAAIAREKAGIIKRRRPVVVGALPPEAEEVITAVALERGAPLHLLQREFEARRESPTDEGERFWYRGRRFAGPLQVSLRGLHQVANAGVAAYAAELAGELGLPIPVREPHLAQGLCTLRVPGRFTVLPGEPPLVLDGAHNPDAARALAKALGERFGDRPWVLLFGVVEDKDHLEILRALAPHTKGVVAVRPQSLRARDPAEVVRSCRELDLVAEAAADLESGLDRARALAGHGGLVVVTGSFYTLAAAMRVLRIGGEADPVPLSDPVRPLP
jgi:dihydrofolate synthase/folylpolyglutamate synthase